MTPELQPSPGAAGPEELVPVTVRQVPVRLWAQAQEHANELFREFALIAVDPRAAGSVPARLTDLVAALSAAYGGLSTHQEGQLMAAAEAGIDEVDLAYALPRAAGEASRRLASLLDEADEFCRAGRHLLTLTTAPELVAFRRWYLEEFRAQIEGAAPVPWPQYRDR